MNWTEPNLIETLILALGSVGIEAVDVIGTSLHQLSSMSTCSYAGPGQAKSLFHVLVFYLFYCDVQENDILGYYK